MFLRAVATMTCHSLKRVKSIKRGGYDYIYIGRVVLCVKV